MSSRNRSLRINGSRRQRRSLPPLIENLENRMLLSDLLPNTVPLSATTTRFRLAPNRKSGRSKPMLLSPVRSAAAG